MQWGVVKELQVKLKAVKAALPSPFAGDTVKFYFRPYVLSWYGATDSKRMKSPSR